MKAILCFYLLTSAILVSHAAEISDRQTINEPYDFPVKPGTQAWAELKGLIDQVAACEIPRALAERMTTDALVKTCMNYPLRGTVLAHNNPHVGVAFLLDNFYGFKELFKRGDSGKTLVEWYRENRTKLIESKNYFIEMGFIQAFLSKPEVLVQFTSVQKEEVARLCLKNVRDLRKKHGPNSSEIEAARVAVHLIAKEGVMIKYGVSNVDKNRLPAEAEQFLRRQPVSPGFLKSIQSLAEQDLE